MQLQYPWIYYYNLNICKNNFGHFSCFKFIIIQINFDIIFLRKNLFIMPKICHMFSNVTKFPHCMRNNIFCHFNCHHSLWHNSCYALIQIEMPNRFILQYLHWCPKFLPLFIFIFYLFPPLAKVLSFFVHPICPNDQWYHHLKKLATPYGNSLLQLK